MEMVQQNMLMAMVQSAPQNAAPRDSGTESAQSDFRKLMEQQTERPATEPAAKQETETVTTSQNTDSAEETEMTLQELAASQLVQTFVLPVQSVTTQETVVANAPAAVLQQAEAAQQMLPQTQSTQQTVSTAPAVENTAQPELGDAVSAPVEMPTGTENSNRPQDNAFAHTMARSDRPVSDEPVVTVREIGNTAEVDAEVDAETVETEEGTRLFAQVDTAPVKVSETAAPMETANTAPAAPVEKQVEVAVAQAMENGETKVEVFLEPAELGKVKIELVQQKDGTLHITLHAENSNTRAMLERDAGTLQAALRSATQQETQVDVPRQEETRQDAWQDGHNRQEQQQQQQRRNSQRDGEDFLHQLRLGLAPLDEAV